ncbi:MAG TPA: hypothetical protein VFV49_07225 [Thermoanaerobaculia bacterium]|nr:hypothetical protein [Thermoanaerobaculia bacterium]
MSASSLAEPLPAAATATSEREEAPRWSLALRIVFRFVFSFFTLMYFPFPLDLIPSVATALQKVWDAIVVAFGKALFGLTVDTVFNGSGDRTYDWIRLLLMVGVSVLATLIWSLADRKAVSHPRLWRWFHMYIRFGLAYAMFMYGAMKIIPTQFSTPRLDRLLQPIGDASPMGLLWTFMGASTAYVMFTGFGELLGGLLLTNRRTTLLGALVTAAVMTQVVALNFFYDVPVKIYSSELLFTALIIAAPDAQKLLRFFILDRSSEPLFTHPKLRIAAKVTVVLLVGYLGFTPFKESWDLRQSALARWSAKSPLSGIWTIEREVPASSAAWRRLIIAGPQRGAIQTMDESITRYRIALDEKKKTLVFTNMFGPKFEAAMNYEHPDPKTLILSGQFDGKNIVATLHREDDRTFRLTSRGFHWVNEGPFNR